MFNLPSAWDLDVKCFHMQLSCRNCIRGIEPDRQVEQSRFGRLLKDFNDNCVCRKSGCLTKFVKQTQKKDCEPNKRLQVSESPAALHDKKVDFWDFGGKVKEDSADRF